MKDIDDIIINVLKKEITEPVEYESAIKNAFEYKTKYRKRMKLGKFAIICSCIISVTGIVYASNVITNFFNNNKGIDVAIENGYIDEPKIKYVESNDINITVKNFLMDDFNLNFAFEINFDNNINVNDIARIRLPDLIITDEKNRIIYCENEEALNNYNKENNIDYSIDALEDENYINSGSNWYIKNKIKDSNTVELIYNFYASKYPKSKEIYIKFTQINLTEYEISENEEIILNGNWQIKLEVPEKFYNREALVYSVKSCSNPNLNITEATLYDTCFKLEFDTNIEPIYEETDSVEIQREKMNKLNTWLINELSNLRRMAMNEYILNDLEEKFYPLNSNSEDSRVDYFPDGRVEYMQLYDLTKFDKNSNHIKVYLTLNLPTIQEDIEIELERK